MWENEMVVRTLRSIHCAGHIKFMRIKFSFRLKHTCAVGNKEIFFPPDNNQFLLILDVRTEGKGISFREKDIRLGMEERNNNNIHLLQRFFILFNPSKCLGSNTCDESMIRGSFLISLITLRVKSFDDHEWAEIVIWFSVAIRNYRTRKIVVRKLS